MQFLSPEWFAAFSRALDGCPATDDTSRVGIGQIVIDSPFGEVRYTVFVGGGFPAIAVGVTDDASVTLVTDYATACAIGQGAAPAQLLYDGKVRVRGDANTLLSAHSSLVGVAAALGEVASHTTF